jgi:hypothetical protein
VLRKYLSIGFLLRNAYFSGDVALFGGGSQIEARATQHLPHSIGRPVSL